MEIKVSKIPVNGLKINEKVSFDETYIAATSVKKLDDVLVQGEININEDANVVVNLTASGNMILEDAIDLSEIEYPFEVLIDEIIETSKENEENVQNTLDIMNVLWQNIVLEIPIRAVKEENENISLKGDGWELVNSEEKNIDSRLAPLLDLLEEGKED